MIGFLYPIKTDQKYPIIRETKVEFELSLLQSRLPAIPKLQGYKKKLYFCKDISNQSSNVWISNFWPYTSLKMSNVLNIFQINPLRPRIPWGIKQSLELN